MRFTRGDVRGPYRFIQNRSRISVVALKSDAAAEKPKDQLSRDFLGWSIFDFCNNICQQETPAPQQFNAAYSITSSARASSLAGTAMPSAFAVVRVIRSSNFVGCSAGISAGLLRCIALITK